MKIVLSLNGLETKTGKEVGAYKVEERQYNPHINSRTRVHDESSQNNLH